MIIMNLNMFMILTLNNGTYIGCPIMFPSLGGLLCQVVHQHLLVVLQQMKVSVSGKLLVAMEPLEFEEPLELEKLQEVVEPLKVEELLDLPLVHKIFCWHST